MAIPTVDILESEMSLHAGQEKKLLRGQIIIAKVTLERAPGMNSYCVMQHVAGLVKHKISSV